MPTTYKVLGQVKPAAGTLTTAYTVPSATLAVISTIAICNIGAAPTTYKIAVRPSGASISDEMYIVYETSIAPQDTVNLTIGITLSATDVVSVESFNGLVTFNLFGSEIA
jgi:hypothetical protein